MSDKCNITFNIKKKPDCAPLLEGASNAESDLAKYLGITTIINLKWQLQIENTPSRLTAARFMVRRPLQVVE